jgi:hypothetical protein
MNSNALSRLAAIILTGVLPGAAYAQALPSTEEFQNLMTTCAQGSDLHIDADIIGSAASIYSGERTKGAASLKSQTRFLELFPPEDRLEAAKLYQACITDFLRGKQSSEKGAHIGADTQWPSLNTSSKKCCSRGVFLCEVPATAGGYCSCPDGSIGVVYEPDRC